MQRKFLTNLILLLFLNLLIKPFWILGIDRAVQNSIGAEDYGFYYALFNFSFLLNILLDLGITNFNNRNISQNNQLIKKHLSSIFSLKLSLGVLYMIVSLCCGLIIGYSFKQFQFLLLLCFNQFLIYLILYLRSNIAGLFLFKTDSVVSVLDRTFMIAICAVLLWGNVTGVPMKIEWFIYAQTAAYFLTAVIAFLIVFRKAEFFRLKWDYPFSMMILKKSFPFAVLILLMTFYNRIDTVMMERMLPEGENNIQAGIYAQAYRLLDATNMIAYLYAGLLLPLFSRMVKQRDSVEDLVKLSFRLLVIPAMMIASASFFYQKEIMELLYHEHTAASAPVFGLLMGCFIPVSSSYIFGTLLTANGNLKALNIMAASGMLLNITLNIFLIPKLYAYGSAIASFITQGLTAITQVIIVQYIFKFKVNFRMFLKFAFFIAGILLAGYYSKNIHSNWAISFAAMTVFYIAISLATGIISIKSLYHIVKYGER